MFPIGFFVAFQRSVDSIDYKILIMAGFTLKVKTKQGQYVVQDFAPTETIGKLKLKIAELTKIPAECLNVLTGFPPRPINLSMNECIVSELGILNGDTLIVEEKSMPDVVPQQHINRGQMAEDGLLAQQMANEEDSECGLATKGILLKQVVPSDNSCLFTSIGTYAHLTSMFAIYIFFKPSMLL